MKRAFTLVELLVVLSVVSMLASITMVRVSVAQANARDTVRTQQIKQVDQAVQMYIQDKGYAPPIYASSTNCDIQSQTPTTYEQVSACFAVSTASVGSPQSDAWNTFMNELSDYIKIPNDPCPSCDSQSGFPIGYTYVAPFAMQYYCSINSSGTGCPASNSSYQTYAPLERRTVPTGSGGSTENYAMSSGDGGGSTFSTPTSAIATLEYGNNILFSWNATPGATGYNAYRDDLLRETTTSLSAYDDALPPNTTYCWSVEAYNATGETTARSVNSCVTTDP